MNRIKQVLFSILHKYSKKSNKMQIKKYQKNNKKVYNHYNKQNNNKRQFFKILSHHSKINQIMIKVKKLQNPYQRQNKEIHQD